MLITLHADRFKMTGMFLEKISAIVIEFPSGHKETLTMAQSYEMMKALEKMLGPASNLEPETEKELPPTEEEKKNRDDNHEKLLEKLTDHYPSLLFEGEKLNILKLKKGWERVTCPVINCDATIRKASLLVHLSNTAKHRGARTNAKKVLTKMPDGIPCPIGKCKEVYEKEVDLEDHIAMTHGGA